MLRDPAEKLTAAASWPNGATPASARLTEINRGRSGGALAVKAKGKPEMGGGPRPKK
jgi:hypothetical protein